MKLIIGLTGRTGSGKSLAADIFRNLGAFVADCDKIAHAVLLDENVKVKIRNEISPSVFSEDGSIDRKKLGGIVFSNKEKLATLNSIVHPEVVRTVLSLCDKAEEAICIIDGSELEASGIDKKCAHIIVITADEKVRLERIMRRDGICRESALARIGAQKDYSKEAITVINNTTADSLTEQITKLYKDFSGEINAQ